MYKVGEFYSSTLFFYFLLYHCPSSELIKVKSVKSFAFKIKLCIIRYQWMCIYEPLGSKKISSLSLHNVPWTKFRPTNCK